MTTAQAWSRYARKGTTTQRGYGWQHIKAVRAARAAWRPGDLCAICGQPMWTLWTQDQRGRRVCALDLGHTIDRTAYIGLTHRYCNRAEGRSRQNRTSHWSRTRNW